MTQHTETPHPVLTITDHYVQAVSIHDPEDCLMIRRTGNSYAIEICDGKFVAEHYFATTAVRQWADQLRWAVRPAAIKADGGVIEIRLGIAAIHITADAAAAIVEFVRPTATDN